MGEHSIGRRVLTLSGQDAIILLSARLGMFGNLLQMHISFSVPLFTTKAKGIRLGLAMAKTLVGANRGSIEVESPSTPILSRRDRIGLRTGGVGKGSTFTVRLPIDRE